MTFSGLQIEHNSAAFSGSFWREIEHLQFLTATMPAVTYYSNGIGIL